jgi:hypothetical protein
VAKPKAEYTVTLNEPPMTRASMTNREIMQQALAKLEHIWEIGIDAEYRVDLMPEINALRHALAQPEQEPVAWMQDSTELYVKDHPTSTYTIPLYTAPPRKPWVSLTDDEMFEFLSDGVDGREDINNIEEALRSKNT